MRLDSGERRISPGPTIYAGEHWLVEHAYPVGIKGWLVLVLRRHLEAVHDLSGEELGELAGLLAKSSTALREHLGCEKEYVACFAEAEHFHHVHFHVIARPTGLGPELLGPQIFKLLGPAQEAVAPGEIKELCEQLQKYFG